MVIVDLTFYSFANHRGLVLTGIHRYSRNPGYIGWAMAILIANILAARTAILVIMQMRITLKTKKDRIIIHLGGINF
jgi:protein-S-isoprenylcysteine O-methyltransferase Ste14